MKLNKDKIKDNNMEKDLGDFNKDSVEVLVDSVVVLILKIFSKELLEVNNRVEGEEEEDKDFISMVEISESRKMMDFFKKKKKRKKKSI